MKHILLEACCGSAEDVIEAAKGGTGRAELCSDPFHGGLTPSIGGLKVAKAGCDIPVMAMVRIIRETGREQIHLAVHKQMFDPSVSNNRSIYYGGCLYPPEDVFRVTDSEAIGAMTGRLKE